MINLGESPGDEWRTVSPRHKALSLCVCVCVFASQCSAKQALSKLTAPEIQTHKCNHRDSVKKAARPLFSDEGTTCVIVPSGAD